MLNTLETTEVTEMNSHSAVPSTETDNFCQDCRGSSAFLSLEETALFLKTESPRALRFIIYCSIHCQTDANGDVRICLVSLLKKQKLLRRSHELIAEVENKHPDL